MTTLKAVAASVGISLVLFCLGCGVVAIPVSDVSPSISKVLPGSLVAGSQGVTMTVVGANFSNDAVVLWNGSTLSTNVVNGSTLAAPVPQSNLTSPAVVQLMVRDGKSGHKSNPVNVTISSPNSGSSSSGSSGPIVLPLTVVTSTLPAGAVGTAYNGGLSASGGALPYTWSIAEGQLPAGISLDASNGELSGTPSASGTFVFTVKVSDAGRSAQTATAQISMAVKDGPTVSTSPTTGGASTSGSNSGSGATTSTGAGSPATLLSASVTSLAVGRVSQAYSTAVTASGGTTPYAWSITSGQLPAGLSMASTGAISGTPTQAGSFSFTVTAIDSGNPAQTASATDSITILASEQSGLTITTTSLPSATAGQAYSAALQAGGGTGPYTWSLTSGSLPTGLSLSASGAISGTPQASTSVSGGSSTGTPFTVSVKDSSNPAQSATLNASIAVVAPSQLAITTTSLPSGTNGTAYSTTLQATGGTPAYTWTISSGSLPAGLTLGASTGTISGTPSSTGTSSFTIAVSDNANPQATKSVSMAIAVTAAQQNAGPGTTWFVRPDGGTRYSSNMTTGQCDGKADVAYPGNGTNQHCAFNDVRYMWMDGSYGNSAWVMSGGDTLVIRGCAALPSQQNPDAPHCRIGWDKGTGNDAQNFWCAGVNAFWGCSMPPPPSGTASQPTRILGACAYGTYTCNPVVGYPYTSNNLTQLFGGFNVGAVMYLSGSKYVDVEGLEITSHNGQCTRVGAPAYPAACSTSMPVGDFANWGIITTNTTSNILLQDVYIHGLTTVGIGGPIGGAFKLTRVLIAFNAFAGWNFDDGKPTPDAPGSSITQSYVTMIGNGCLEEYPIVHTKYPAKACWDSNSGGFGDSWSGQDTQLDSFSCDHCMIIDNTKDGAMGPHTRIKSLTLTNSMFGGNMGQQGKWGTTQGATTLVENNLIIGNCNRMSEQLPGAAQNFNLNTGLPGSYLSNFCRAAGDVFSYFSDAGSTVLFANNSVVAASPTVFDLGCGTANNCTGVPYTFTNNIFLGYTTTTSYYPFNGEAPGLFYKADPSVNIASSYNVEYGLRNGDCLSAGTGIVCSDPLLVNEPAQGAYPPESILDNFNFHLSSGSPAINAGTSYSGMLTTDFFGVTQTSPSIGAVGP